MIKTISRYWNQLFIDMKMRIKQRTRPTTAAILVGSLSDLKRGRRGLIIENAMLRQRLIVLKLQVKRVQFTQGDRVRLVLLARFTGFWQQALHIVEPATLLRWHRDLFRSYWRLKSKPKQRKPSICPRPSSSSSRWPGKTFCGSTTHPWRTAEAGDQDQQAHDPEVHVHDTEGNWSNLEHLLEEPRSPHLGL